uniref:Serine protease 54 n=1 Tax=Mamestra configurata TaxID=174822 RepID=E7D006_9NEOP|nr:serine protease 54 [Mamestra configurata]
MNKCLLLFVIAICGTHASSINAERANRIVEGATASVNQFQYMVSLQKISELQSYTRGHRCGGALVTLQHAVTAASCNFDIINGVSVAIAPVEHRVFAGAVTLTSDNSPYHIRNIINITVHPDYYASSLLVNDIAVIFLESAFSSTIAPVLLPIRDAGVTEPTPCYVSGWGAQNDTATASVQLMYLQKRIQEQQNCRAYYGSLPVGPLNVVDSMICAFGDQQTPFSGCTGDIGNPLVCSGYLNGILVRSKKCIVSPDSEVYTRISSYTTWINGTITGQGSGAASTFQPGMVVLAVIAIAQIIIANVIN